MNWRRTHRRPVSKTKQASSLVETILIAAAVVALWSGCRSSPNPRLEAASRAASEADLAVGGVEGSRSAANRPSTPKDRSQERVPDWLGRPPTDIDYFVGIGGAPDTGSPVDDIEKARRNARSALASEIGVTIRSRTSLEARDNSLGDAQDAITVLIDEQVNVRLSGVQLVDSYHSPAWGYWFYYRLPRTALDPRSTVERTVADLVRLLGRPARLSFGRITYAETGLASPLTLYLENQILLALMRHPEITVSASSIGSNSSTAPPNVPSGPDAVPPGAEPRVRVDGVFYVSSSHNTTVFIRLVDEAKDAIVAQSSFELDAAQLPFPISGLLPENFAVAVATKEVLSDLHTVASRSQEGGEGLRLRLSTDRGDGRVYLDGEELAISFSTNKSCFIKVYHIDVNGRVSLILPNRYSRTNYCEAERVYTIPGQKAPYRFTLGRPYGVEYIKVVAATVQFEDIEPSFQDLGPATRGNLTRGLRVQGSSEPEMAEALVSYTIVARK